MSSPVDRNRRPEAVEAVRQAASSLAPRRNGPSNADLFALMSKMNDQQSDVNKQFLTMFKDVRDRLNSVEEKKEVKRAQWKSAHTLKLIDLCREHIVSKRQMSSLQVHKKYEHIASEINELFGTKYSLVQAREKWKALNKQYKEVLDADNETGVGAPNEDTQADWFIAMRAVHGDAVELTDESLVQSAPLSPESGPLEEGDEKKADAAAVRPREPSVSSSSSSESSSSDSSSSAASSDDDRERSAKSKKKKSKSKKRKERKRRKKSAKKRRKGDFSVADMFALMKSGQELRAERAKSRQEQIDEATRRLSGQGRAAEAEPRRASENKSADRAHEAAALSPPPRASYDDEIHLD